MARSPLRMAAFVLLALVICATLWRYHPAFVWHLQLQPQIEGASLSWPVRLRALPHVQPPPESSWPQLRLGPLEFRLPAGELRYAFCVKPEFSCLFRYPEASVIVELRSSEALGNLPARYQEIARPLSLASSDSALFHSRSTAVLLTRLGRMRLDPVLGRNLDLVGYRFNGPGYRGILLEDPVGDASIHLFSRSSDLQASVVVAAAGAAAPGEARRLVAGLRLSPERLVPGTIHADMREIELHLPSPAYPGRG